MNTFEKIYNIVKQIPKGRVSTYGTIAALCGNPKMSRVVGYALHANPDEANIPCFRVVNRFGECSGSFAFGGKNAQEEKLKQDGIEVLNGKVDLNKYRWP